MPLRIIKSAPLHSIILSVINNIFKENYFINIFKTDQSIGFRDPDLDSQRNIGGVLSKLHCHSVFLRVNSIDKQVIWCTMLISQFDHVVICINASIKLPRVQIYLLAT